MTRFPTAPSNLWFSTTPGYEPVSPSPFWISLTQTTQIGVIVSLTDVLLTSLLIFLFLFLCHQCVPFFFCCCSHKSGLATIATGFVLHASGFGLGSLASCMMSPAVSDNGLQSPPPQSADENEAGEGDHSR